MILAVDIGNTDIVIGLNHEGKWLNHWRTPSKKDTPSATFNHIIKSFFLEDRIDIDQVEGIALSSVVPYLTEVIKDVIESLLGKEVMVLDAQRIGSLGLGENVNPYQIGSDLVCNAVGAFKRYNQNAVIVDFGTALTFTSIDDKGQVMGVAIAPGVRTAMKSLANNTARLPEIPLEIPEKVYGNNTIEAMQAGIMQGYVGMVRYMIAETKKRHSQVPKVIATGGLSFVFKPLHDVFDEIDVNLTLNGLLTVYDKLDNQS